MRRLRQTPVTSAGPDPDALIGYSLVRLGHLLERRVDSALDGLPLSVRQMGVLGHAARRPGIGSSELARLVFITPQSMGTQLDALERLKLIKRTFDPSVGISVRITPKGESVLKRAYDIARREDSSLISALSVTQRRGLQTLLERILETASESDAAEPTSAPSRRKTPARRTAAPARRARRSRPR